ncbi:MAG: NTP transferase domain-containing protein [Planctomycetes bacterium]|nr:NTP transferase domain-containing protein [Planctomycetota bacterium]
MSPLAAVAIVPAAGLGRRMGTDKGLLRLGGTTLLERVVATCAAAGIDRFLVVRRRGADPVPPGLAAEVVEVPAGGEMADSLRAARNALPTAADRVVVFPVDHALVETDTVLALLAAVAPAGAAIARPTHRGRPGHPIALQRSAFDEIAAAGTVLRDIVRRDPTRVRDIATGNPWVVADLDDPDDLRGAQAALAAGPHATVEQMFRHRSRRAFRPDPIPDHQLERLVDAARHASTSSYIQAYSVVAVSDPGRKDECARLCGGQRHVAEAPLFLAICADLSKLAAACEQHGTALQSQSFELFLQATVDAALFGQNLQLAAESEGLGGCMIGGARNHPIELAALLGLPSGAFVVFGMTLGVPADDPAPRRRMPLGGVLHREAYDRAAAIAALGGADEIMRDWARRANAADGGYAGRPIDESKGWTDRMARAWGEQSSYAAARRSLVAELRRLGFGLEQG